jgi:hypothetical protein
MECVPPVHPGSREIEWSNLSFMGEISELVLEGELCGGCGVYIGPGKGVPETCTICGGTAKPYGDMADD